MTAMIVWLPSSEGRSRLINIWTWSLHRMTSQNHSGCQEVPWTRPDRAIQRPHSSEVPFLWVWPNESNRGGKKETWLAELSFKEDAKKATRVQSQNVPWDTNWWSELRFLEWYFCSSTAHDQSHWICEGAHIPSWWDLSTQPGTPPEEPRGGWWFSHPAHPSVYGGAGGGWTRPAWLTEDTWQRDEHEENEKHEGHLGVLSHQK